MVIHRKRGKKVYVASCFACDVDDRDSFREVIVGGKMLGRYRKTRLPGGNGIARNVCLVRRRHYTQKRGTKRTVPLSVVDE
jgi:hypothetical protein